MHKNRRRNACFLNTVNYFQRLSGIFKKMFLKRVLAITAGGKLAATSGRFFFAASGNVPTAISGASMTLVPPVNTVINKPFVEPLKSFIFIYLNGSTLDEIYR